MKEQQDLWRPTASIFEGGTGSSHAACGHSSYAAAAAWHRKGFGAKNMFEVWSLVPQHPLKSSRCILKSPMSLENYTPPLPMPYNPKP